MLNFGLPNQLFQFEKHIQCPEVSLNLQKNGSRVRVSLGVASFIRMGGRVFRVSHG